ncbi:MAG: hypothetical protein ABUL55_00335 [Pseudomonadota bacterium]
MDDQVQNRATSASLPVIGAFLFIAMWGVVGAAYIIEFFMIPHPSLGG